MALVLPALQPRIVPDQFTIPDDFTDDERAFVLKVQIALVEGLQLERWTRDPDRRINQFRLSLAGDYLLDNTAYGYFSDVKISGKTLTALGVRQEVGFGKIAGPDAEARLKDFVLNCFLSAANWTYPNGDQGGFTYKQMIYCTLDGHVGRYRDDQLNAITPWKNIGVRYAWSLVTIFLHDFILKLGPLSASVKEAVAVVLHPDFVHIVQNPKPGFRLEVAIGYPFIDYAPVHNYFGWGPGKFDWAVKTYSFLLADNGEVRCNMDFVAGARAKKVLDFGKDIPDPFYGTAAALQYLSLGLLKPQRFHDVMDGQMAVQHARVHQALMEGTAKIFKAWRDESSST